MLLHERLAQQFPHAKQTTLRRMLQAGRVRLNGVVVRRWKEPVGEADELQISDTVEVATPTLRRGPARPHPVQIVWEDADLLVIDKPAGLLTSTVPGERRPTVLALLHDYLHELPTPAATPSATMPATAERLGLIHRLDKDASGLLVFSKNEETYRGLKQQFFKHTVERVYLAVTRGVPTPASGRVEDKLIELPNGSVRRSVRPDRGEVAITDYQTLTRGAGFAAVRVQLHTGRKHQIRVHLAGRGAPIVGDRMYHPPGSPVPASRLMLAALVLGFIHPRTGKPVRFDRPVPSDFPLLARETLSPDAHTVG